MIWLFALERERGWGGGGGRERKRDRERGRLPARHRAASRRDWEQSWEQDWEPERERDTQEREREREGERDTQEREREREGERERERERGGGERERERERDTQTDTDRDRQREGGGSERMQALSQCVWGKCVCSYTRRSTKASWLAAAAQDQRTKTAHERQHQAIPFPPLSSHTHETKSVTIAAQILQKAALSTPNILGRHACRTKLPPKKGGSFLTYSWSFFAYS